MSAGTSTNPKPDDNPGSGKEGLNPEPEDPFSSADRRAESQARQFARELRKQALRGVAFEAGKETLKEIIHLLTQHH